MDERQEQRLLSLVTQAALRNDDRSFVEFWTAATALNNLEPGERVEMLATILRADPQVALIWVTFLLSALGKMEAQFEEIADGIEFEHDGMRLVAQRID